MAYQFHYTPTGTGVISGKEVLEQTEDAINDLGNTAISGVQEALDKAEQALTNSANAVDDAQTALNTANNAEGVAIQAQNDVSNLSGTVTNIGNRVTTAEGNISNLQGRMTTAEGNITNLQGRMTTAETNIGNLQTAVSTAQATANSAQQTATTARQQSYVFRYSSTALVASSTNSNTLLDNTDNLKVGDKVIDSSGVLFSITAIDTQNSTFTIGTALVDLAQDSDVVHKSGDETISGTKTFLDVPIPLKSSTAELGVTGGNTKVIFTDKNLLNLAGITFGNYGSSKLSYCRFHIYDKDSNNQEVENFIEFSYVNNNQTAYFRPNKSNFVTLGTVNNRWSKVYADEYYYGSNNIEFSTKFVTTDTNQTISGAKTFSEDIVIGNSDTTQNSKRLVLKSYKASLSGSNSDTWGISFNAGSSYAVTINASKDSNGTQGLSYSVRTQDSNNNIFSSSYHFRVFIDGNSVLEPGTGSVISLGRSTNRWKDVQTNLVNGLTPSSLSMPSDNIANIIDISGYLTVLDGSQANTYQAPDNGYISITMNNCSSIQAFITGFWGNQIVRPTAGVLRFFMPICKNMTANILVFGGTIDNARFIPCQGNI